MSIKPVDFQIMIPKAMEVSRVNSEDTHKNIALQQQQAAFMQHKVDNTLKQVYSKAGSQNVKISEKQKDGKRNRGEKKKHDAGNSTEEYLIESIKTSTIDIKI